MQHKLKLLPLLVLAALATGCAVQPKQIGMDERQASLAEDNKALFDQQDAVSGAVSLEEAMARALKHNLDFRVKLMEAENAAQVAAITNDFLNQI